jgi:hypothetical protein
MLFDRAFRNTQPSSNLPIRAMVHTMQQKNFAAAGRESLQSLSEEDDALSVQQGALGRWLRTGKIDCLIQRFNGSASRAHLPEMIQGQIACCAEEKSARMRDDLFTGRTGDAEIAFLGQVGGRFLASHKAGEPADQDRLVLPVEPFDVCGCHISRRKGPAYLVSLR